MNAATIADVRGLRIWDSRGRPTIEAVVTLVGGAAGKAIAPAGASLSSAEAAEKRDGGARFGGFDVCQAVGLINGEIASALRGQSVIDQTAIDQFLIELDGTPNKSRLGGNTIVAISMAAAHAAAASVNMPLWRYLNASPAYLPLPEVQIFGGGAHAGGRVDVQDFMVIAVGASSYAEALDWTAEIYRAAGELMDDAGKLQGVADEGGFWPVFDSNELVLEMLVRSIERAGLHPGEQIGISLDVAASQFGSSGRYRLGLENRELDSDGLIELLLGWTERYPIVAVEDPLAEDDGPGLERFTRACQGRIEVVGDDFIATNSTRIIHASRAGICNAVLIKPNQAGTLSESLGAVHAARSVGYEPIMSARSGETEDTTIVDLAVGWGIKMLKVGSFARSERMAKWNAGLRIADSLGRGPLPPRSAFRWRK